MPDRELTQQDVMEAWKLQSIFLGKQSDYNDGAKARAEVESATAMDYEKAQGAAQRDYDKAIATAMKKRDDARNASQADLDKLAEIMSKAQGDLDAYQEKLRAETGAIAQLPNMAPAGGGRTNI